MASTVTPEAAKAAPEPPKLPKLSGAQFREYNRLAEHMDFFHNNFRRTWTMMYDSCSSGSRPAGMSIRQFINVGLQFCHHLETHHSIEEQYIFPDLARKMPAFEEDLRLLSQHKKIHAGLEKFEEYLGACKGGERELRMEELKDLMDDFGKVLWDHLNDEVKELGAENMREHWTIEEMRMLSF